MTEAAPKPGTVVSFAPDGGNGRALRDAFGHFATGVTVVTVRGPDGPVAIVANSFSSLSLNPPLVLWSPDRASRRFSYFDRAELFAIHVLGAEQEDLCKRVAGDAFGLLPDDLALSPNGTPILRDCLARFECQHWATYDGGDHTITVGMVLRVALRDDGSALGFFRGRMMRVTAAEPLAMAAG